MPVLEGEAELLASTRAWWRTVWSSPMASVYLDVDVAGLTRLAVLVDRAARGDKGSRVLSEIRSLEDRYGLSPLARRRLQWEIDKAAGQSPKGDSQSEGDGRWLRALA